MREEIGHIPTKNNCDVCLRFAPVAVQRSRGGKAIRAAQSRQRGALCSLYSGRRRPDEVEVRQGLVCPVALDPRHRVYGATLLEEGRVGTENTPCSDTSKTRRLVHADALVGCQVACRTFHPQKGAYSQTDQTWQRATSPTAFEIAHVNLTTTGN
ncbi:uncharacterized protein LOC126236494 isoform X1 [Schistocerca nitens]|uniref:uncharacterized protein LOC126236494 isoform X1 n=1 Tax=Schistocerca nitens TaxID=7011 RepID=UPI002117CACD|nr:uncharacterized protein LOC126236494 isoform X1 [Schistocerca nitens]